MSISILENGDCKILNEKLDFMLNHILRQMETTLERSYLGEKVLNKWFFFRGPWSNLGSIIGKLKSEFSTKQKSESQGIYIILKISWRLV